MTLFEAIEDRVTAKQAAEFYGLQFGRNGRCRCVWHDDHKPDLAFYNSNFPHPKVQKRATGQGKTKEK